MKKLIFGIILLFCVNSYAINGFSIYKMYTQYDTVTHSNLDSNLNRPASWSSLLVDTLDRKFIRFSDLTSGDTTLSSIKVDTIRSNPYIDSTKGNTIHTGTYTVSSTVSVDSLKSTKGINATSGTFSGALTSQTLNTGNGDNELYAMNQNIRTTDAPTFATLNTGNGDNELYPMDQDMRTTASPTHVLGTYTDGVRAYNATSNGSYVGLFKSQGALPGFPSSYYPVLKTDYSSLYFSAGGFYAAAMAKEVFAIPDSTGKHHIFSVENDTTTAKIIKADSIKLGSGSYLKTYVEGTMACTLKTSSVTVEQVADAYYTKIGNVVTISFPVLAGTSNSGTFRVHCRIPYKPKQEYDGYNYFMEPAILTNNGKKESGYITYYEYTPTYLDLTLYSGSFTTSGIKGLNPFSVSYITE